MCRKRCICSRHRERSTGTGHTCEASTITAGPACKFIAAVGSRDKRHSCICGIFARCVGIDRTTCRRLNRQLILLGASGSEALYIAFHYFLFAVNGAQRIETIVIGFARLQFCIKSLIASTLCRIENFGITISRGIGISIRRSCKR